MSQAPAKSPDPSFDSLDSLAKWATLALIAIATILVFGPAVRAKARPVAGIEPVSAVSPLAPVAESDTPKAEVPKPTKPAPRVLAMNAAGVPMAPRAPSNAEIAACNQQAAAARTSYGLGERAEDDARADSAYRACMAQRGF